MKNKITHKKEEKNTEKLAYHKNYFKWHYLIGKLD